MIQSTNKSHLNFSILKSFRMILPGIFMAVTGCQDIEKPDILLSLLLNNGTGKMGIITSDLGGAGRFGTISFEGVPTFSLINIHSDAIARYTNKRVYIINRLGRDNIQILNPEFFYFTEREFSTQPGSNPQDFIRVNDDLAYVSRYELTNLLIMNPTTGLTGGEINLAAWADADGIPEMSGMYLDGHRLFVALQKLDRNHPVSILPPTANSSLIEIDTRSNTVTTEHILPATNPFGKLKQASLFGQNYIIITNPGGIGVNHALDGGVVAFNTTTNNFRPGFLYHETTAGGDILSVEIKDDSTGYALVMFADFSMALQTFNPANGAIVSTLAYYPPTGGFVSEILLGQNDFLYVANATTNSPGITIYDTNNANQSLTAVPVSAGLRPTGLVEIP